MRLAPGLRLVDLAFSDGVFGWFLLGGELPTFIVVVGQLTLVIFMGF